MTLEAYKENLVLFSLRIPFESDKFIETFIEFDEWYKKHSDLKANEVHSKFKLILLHTLKIRCKLVDINLIKLIPNRMEEFDSTIINKKEYLWNIYSTGVLSVEEYDDILETIELDRLEIINQVIQNRIIATESDLSFKSIKDTVLFIESLKDVDMEYVYQWRKAMKRKVVKRWFTSLLC